MSKPRKSAKVPTPVQGPIVVIPTDVQAIATPDATPVQAIATPDVPTPSVPIDPAPTDPTPDVQAIDATDWSADRAPFGPTDAPGSDVPTPVQAPTDPGLPIASNVDPAGPTAPGVVPTLPTIIVPNIQAPTPYAPKLSAPAMILAMAYVTDVARVLNVGNVQILAWGRAVQAIIRAERENSTRFGPDEFDSTTRELDALYADRFPSSEATPRIDDHFRFAEFMDATAKLGIIGAESISYRRVVNVLYPATMVLSKETVATSVRDGFGDWLKAIVPMIVRADSPISDATIGASIDAQRVALNAIDPKRFPLPKAKKAKPDATLPPTGPVQAPTGPVQAPTSTPDVQAPTGPVQASAPIVPTEIIPNVNPGAIAPTPDVQAPTSTPVPTPDATRADGLDVQAHFAYVLSHASDFVGSMNPAESIAFAKAIALHASDDVITAFMMALSPRIKAIRAAQIPTPVQAIAG